MALDDIDMLERIGKVTQRGGESKGRHVVEVNISANKGANPSFEVSKYFARQKNIHLISFNYDEEEETVVVKYTEVASGEAKTRGSTGCGSSMIPAYVNR